MRQDHVEGGSRTGTRPGRRKKAALLGWQHDLAIRQAGQLPQAFSDTHELVAERQLAWPAWCRSPRPGGTPRHTVENHLGLTARLSAAATKSVRPVRPPEKRPSGMTRQEHRRLQREWAKRGAR